MNKEFGRHDGIYKIVLKIKKLLRNKRETLIITGVDLLKLNLIFYKFTKN